MTGRTVYAIVLNWKNAPDTLTCLTSLGRVQYPNLKVVVVDNDSGDGSVAAVERWMKLNEGWLAERGGAVRQTRQSSRLQKPGTQYLTIIENDFNAGYAGGNNVGIAFALKDPMCSYVWILNNDVEVEAESLSAMLAVADEDESIGWCAATVMYAHDRDQIQAMGGCSFNKWTGSGRPLGQGFRVTDCSTIPSNDRLAYPLGACILVRRKLVETVGLMEESYFLYFEEIDWVVRGRDRFRIAYAPEAIVYHKEGATIGSSSKVRQRSNISEFLLLRSRLMFTRRHYWYALPSVWCFSVMQSLKRITQGAPRRGLLMLAYLVGVYRPRLPLGARQ